MYNERIESTLYQKPIVVCGCNHTTAPVELREELSRISRSATALAELRDTLHSEEIALLSTCNRFEVIATGDRLRQQEVFEYLGAHVSQKLSSAHLYWHQDREAVRHLFRVAASLDSMVLGEGQILGQLKEAYRQAQEAGTAKKLLHSLFQFSFQLAKRVRSNTSISHRGVSVSYVAVQLAQQILTDLSKTSVLVLGSGRMAELVTIHLSSLGCREITVANRTLSKAHELAARVGGAAITLNDVADVLKNKDLVIGSLAVDRPLVTDDLLARRIKKGPLFFIDLGVPRNFSPNLADHEDVYLYDIDDLSRVTEQNKALRERAANDAELILEYGIHRFEVWLQKIILEPSVLELRALIEKVCSEVVGSTLASDVTQDLARQLSARLSHELLHGRNPAVATTSPSLASRVESFLEILPEKE